MKLFANLYRLASGCKKSLAVLGFLLLFACSIFSLLSGSALAIDLPSHVDNQAESKAIVQGLDYIRKGQWSKGRNILARVKDPLAAKLYFWLVFSKDLKHDEKNYTFTKLSHFIRYNKGWPRSRGFRLQAEKEIPENLRMTDVIRWFDEYPPLSANGMDRYLQALVLLGQTDKARKILSNWWGSSSLDKADQYKIYTKYASFIGHDAHVKRFDYLLFNGQYTNARVIARVLGQGYPLLAEARIALASQKGGVDRYIEQVPDHLKNDPGLMYERLRWRRRKGLDFEAIEILHKAPSADKINNPENWWQERHILIRRLLEEGHHESAYLLASKHIQKEGFSFAQAEWIAGWLALRFMHRPVEAFKRFENLYSNVSSPISKARATYWAGRAAKDFGKPDIAKQWFRQAARYQTTFYGQTGAAELAILGGLPSTAPPVLSPQDLYSFNNDDMIRAARLLNMAGLRDDVSAFLQAFVKQRDSSKAYRFAAELAVSLKHPHDAVRIAKEASNKGMFLTSQSYPLMTSRLRNVTVEWALVHALIRQESMFDYRAESPVGAKGLMQIMPSTAREIARQIGVRHQTNWLINKPDHNIKLGTAYLQKLLDRFDGSYPLAIAAYNAGPARVSKWIKQFGDPRTSKVDLLDWIELIPIYETRNYVQRVMESVYIYRLRLKTVQEKSFAKLHVENPYYLR